jgi:hypothetical protein
MTLFLISLACWTNKSFTCLPLCTDDHILEWSSALDTSVIDKWKINNPTFDVVNDANQDFSLKYSYILNNYIDIIWVVGGGIAPKIFIQLVMPRGPFLGCQRAVFTTVKQISDGQEII